MSKNHRNILNMDLHLSVLPSMPSLLGNSTTVPLYPYRSKDLSVIFFYGSDYRRQINNNLFSKLKIFTFNWTNLFVIFAAIALCFIRRLHKLRRDGFISVLIDVVVIFTGGGNLRMDHKLERWFFVIMSIGAIFLNAICLEPTLFPSFLLNHRSISTFHQLAEINPPIYLRLVLRSNEHLIVEMLRFIFHGILICWRSF